MDTLVHQLADTLRAAVAHKRLLHIRGSGSKDFYGNPAVGNVITTREYRGIIDYEPTELVITARAGTPLEELETALREKGQMLAFEPPRFGGGGTLGGCIAAGLSGPRRPYAGAVRDSLLGVRILDGQGTDLRFGGQVMKNVAGFDVSRLMAGAMGTLGVILEASLKTLPLPAAEATLRLHGDEATAIRWFNQWAGQPLPISATAWRAGEINVRLSGARAAVDAAIQKLGGDVAEPAEADKFWRGLRDHTDPYFADDAPLWRLSIKSTTPPVNLPGEPLIEWNGALRWFKSDAPADVIRDAAAQAGGYATLFRCAGTADKSAGAFHALSPALARLHRNLKQTFDPAGILNRGRLYSDL
jgi:glycolate oxidase FAD binding subunit